MLWEDFKKVMDNFIDHCEEAHGDAPKKEWGIDIDKLERSVITIDFLCFEMDKNGHSKPLKEALGIENGVLEEYHDFTKPVKVEVKKRGRGRPRKEDK